MGLNLPQPTQTGQTMSDSQIFAQLKGSSASPSNPASGATPSGGNDWYSAVKKNSYLPPGSTPAVKQPDTFMGLQQGKNSIPAKLVDALTKNEQNFGQTLGDAAATVDPTFNAALESKNKMDSMNVLLGHAIAMGKAQGKDTSKLENLYKENTGNQFNASDIIPSLNKSAEQIYGEGLGVATDVIGAGSGIGKAGELAKAGEAAKTLTTGEKLLQGAKAGATVGGAVGLGQGVSSGMQNNQNIGGVAKSGLEGGAMGALAGGTIGAGIEGAGSLYNAGKEALSGVAGAAEKIPGQIKGVLTPKRLEEVLATPESQVHKLNPTERNAWFDNQHSQLKTEFDNQHAQLTEKSNAVKETINKNLQASSEATAKKAEALQTQLATASRDKVLELRPKIVQAMREQSQTYRQLVTEGMAGHENVPVDKGALKDFIDARFGEDPGRAAAIKDRLGLTETVNPLSTRAAGATQTPGESIANTKTTLGKIYEQTKALKQELSAGKVFTSDDKLTDDAIHTLSSYMKNQGVDLSEANKFWSRYAPVRDELVTKANPFNQAGTKTKGLADTLIRVAKGTDVNSENFIKESEKILGEPMTNETKAIVKKMSANEKAALATKTQAEMQKAENELATEQAKKGLKTNQSEAEKNLSNKQYETERKAKFRDVMKKVLKYGIVAAGGGEIARHL